MNHPDSDRYQWSRLSRLQLGRYAEYYTKMRLVEAGYEVFGAEVDDRGVDLLVRVGPGRCLEVQVKSERPKATMYVFIQKRKIGSNAQAIASRLRSGFTVSYLLFHDGQEPIMYLVPGTVWLKPNSLFKDYDSPNRKNGPEFGIALTKKKLPLLEPYRFTNQSVEEIMANLEGERS